MDNESRHLAEIVERHNRTCNALVVYLDVEKYSKRRTANQVSVIDFLTESLRAALSAVAKQHLSYAQKNNLNFTTDVITIPTGDGAAVVFTFDGLHSIHLDFASEMLRLAWTARSERCDQFDEHGWCNCHAYINLRVGLAEGKVVVFRDLNGQYNVAGSAVNLAARVMGLSDRNQVLVSDLAYQQIIDMIDDPKFVTQFREFRDVSIKHNEKITVYQYTGADEAWLNRNAPDDLVLKERATDLFNQMRTLGFPSPKMDSLEFGDTKGLINMMERVTGAIAQFQEAVEPVVGRDASAGAKPELPSSRAGGKGRRPAK